MTRPSRPSWLASRSWYASEQSGLPARLNAFVRAKLSVLFT
jgi:hypothetical protein